MMITACVISILLTSCITAEGTDDSDSLDRRFLFGANNVFTGWSSWEQYAACSTRCVSGYEEQTKQCCETGNNRLCYNLPWDKLRNLIGTCPVDGVFDTWSQWSSCDVTCGGGHWTRQRVCIFDPPQAPHGKDCVGSRTEIGTCNNKYPCPVDGRWSSWSRFSRCSVSCGNGTHHRTRKCIYDATAPHGRDCVGDSSQISECHAGACPVDGVFGAWTAWTVCNVSCGGGYRTRHRNCHFDIHAPHGNDCVGSRIQTKVCNDMLCPVDGLWSDWSSFTVCSVSCGGGSQFRTRLCVFPRNAPQGRLCSGGSSEAKDCNTEPCPVDGLWSDWSSFTVCSVSCGGGSQFRSRLCVFPDNVPHGRPCPGISSEAKDCHYGSCPVDGLLGNWSPWSSCSVTCGGGTQTRHRQCTFDHQAPHGNDCIGSLNLTRTCNDNLCPVDGVFGAWSSWSSCSVTCGTGTQTRQRTCNFDPVAPRGMNCTGSFDKTMSCGNSICPVNGIWSSWSNFTSCSKSCGGGTRMRTRDCIFPPRVPQGEYCVGHSRISEKCNTDTCPVSCMLCAGPKIICEKLFAPSVCPSGFCINTVTNNADASRTIDRRCGTQAQCEAGWFNKYSTYDKCVNFNEEFIYTSSFVCEYCCNTDNCNVKINPDTKWYP